MTDPPVCIACGREDPSGGVRLTAEYEWICREVVACALEIARQIREDEQ